MTQVTASPPVAPEPQRRRSPMTFVMIAGVISFLLVVVFYGFSNTMNLLLINPLINLLIVLDYIVLGNFGLAIILFTALLRLATTPITINFFKSSKNMQAAQPKMQEIQKKYKDPQRQRQEMAKIYKEYGINPLGCIFPFAIQIIFFGALYRALVYLVGGSPESLVGLSQRLYPIPFIQDSIPLNQQFLWMDLGQPDSTLILPILVFITTYVQQKMSTPANPTPQQAQQQQMMTWMMPLIITMFMLNLPSGVGLYWVVSNIISLFTGYYVYGRTLSWRNLLPFPPPAGDTPKDTRGAPRKDGDGVRPQPTEAAPLIEDATNGEEPSGAPAAGMRVRHGKRRGKRKNRR